MTTVFISYDRDDSDFAELVQAKLSRAGHTTFMDLEILNVGDDWRDKIDLALRASQVLVVIMTPEAAASHYVAYEWAFALGAGLKVIPLELHTTELHPRLAVLQRILFIDKARPWQKLLEEVQKAPDVTPTDTVRVMENAPPAVKKAVAALDSLDSAEQERAVESLAQMNHPAAQDALIAALQHPSKQVRMKAAIEAAEALLTEPAILTALFEATRSGKWQSNYISQLFKNVLPHIGSSVVPLLMDGLSDRDDAVRWLATYALGEVRDLAAVPGLIRITKDGESDWLRSAAAEALGKLKAKNALPDLLELLRNDPKAHVRAAAAVAIGQIHDATAIPDLLDALKGKRQSIRRAAALALGYIGDPTPITELQVILNNEQEDPDVRRAAGESLIRLKDETAIPTLIDLLLETSFCRGTEIRALEEMGEAAVPGFIRLLDSKGMAEGPQAAAKALKRIGTKEALDAVRKWEFET